jgi:hypothetical protein
MTAQIASKTSAGANALRSHNSCDIPLIDKGPGAFLILISPLHLLLQPHILATGVRPSGKSLMTSTLIPAHMAHSVTTDIRKGDPPPNRTMSAGLPFSKSRSWHRVFGALRSDHACQLVIDTHDHAYGMTRAQSRARRYADSGSADLGPCRPTRSVVNVRVKSVVDSDHAANKLARSLRGAAGIIGHFPTESGIRGPATHRPTSAVESGAKNL